MKTFIDDLPFGVMLSEPIRDSQGTIVNFWIHWFNHLALMDLPPLRFWQEGATLVELFPVETQGVLLDAYIYVCQTGCISQGTYRSKETGRAYYSLLEPCGTGVLAMGIPVEAIHELGRDYPQCISREIIQLREYPMSGVEMWEPNTVSIQEMNLLVGHYKRAVYEHCISVLNRQLTL